MVRRTLPESVLPLESQGGFSLYRIVGKFASRLRDLFLLKDFRLFAPDRHQTILGEVKAGYRKRGREEPSMEVPVH